MDERCAQVRLMGDIYRGARHVIAWIGQSTKETEEAFLFLRQVLSHMSGVDESIKNDESDLPTRKPGDYPSWLQRQVTFVKTWPPEHPGWYCLQHLLSRPYFSRIWILQELWFAKDVTLQNGDDKIPWKSMIKLVSGLDSLSLGHLIFGAYPSCARAIISDLRAAKQTKTSSLLSLLILSLYHESSEPRDRIYALLGLTNDTSNRDIAPRYDISIDAVYRHVTIWIMQQTKDLWIFCQSRPRYNQYLSKGIPSWCVDYSRSDYLPLKKLFKSWHLFRADLGWTAVPRQHENPLLLSFEGRLIDTIYDGQILLDLPSSTLFPGEIAHLRETLPRLRPFLASSKQLYEHVSSFSASQLVLKDYQRTLICGIWNLQLASNTFIDYYHTCMDFVADFCKAADNESNPYIKLSQKYGRVCVDYLSALVVASGHAYFTATHGGRIGWMTEKAEPGDQVAILRGSRLPWVIRKQDVDKWTMVCPCYIEGVMHGELLQGMKEYPFQEMVFC